MINLLKITKNFIFFISILISLKITWVAGYLYCKGLIDLLLKFLHVSDDVVYSSFWKYLPMTYDLININLNEITLMLLPFTNLLLMQTVIISWVCFFFVKNIKIINLSKKSAVLILVLLLFVFIYFLLDIFTLTYNNDEILEILKSTIFLKLIQILIGYNIIVHCVSVFFIFQYNSWNLITKTLISILLLFICVFACSLIDFILIWKEGSVSIVLKKINTLDQPTYLCNAIYEIYNYYGLNVSWCNPESINPCIELKKKMEIACHLSDTTNQFPIYGKSLRSNLIGQILPVGTDIYSGCPGMKKLLQDCIDTHMQNNFINNWNLSHKPQIVYHVPREPIIIKIPKL